MFMKSLIQEKRPVAIMEKLAVAICAAVLAMGLAACGGTGALSSAASRSGDALSSSAVSYKQISQEEAWEMMESESDYVIVDVRRQDEFNSGHIPNAICIPNESIDKEQPAKLPDLDQLIMVYCRSGNRSKQAAEKLSAMGYTNIVEFGGITTWPGEIVK